MNKLKLMASLFAAVVLAAGLSAQTLDEVNTKFNEAGAKLQAKDFVGAIPLLEDVIKQGGEVGADAAETVTQAQKFLPVAYYQVGGGMAAQSKFDEAVAALTKARDLGELYGNVQVSRGAAQMIGKVYFAQGASAYNADDYAKAIEIFSKGYEADPTNTDMAMNLARSYDKSGELEKAVEVYQGVIGLESRHSRYAEPAAEAKNELAIAVLAKASEASDWEDVVRLTDMVLSVDPQNEMANLMRLQIANNLKNYRAVTEYGDAAAEAQTDPEKKSDAYFLLGAAYQNLDNKAKAIEALRKVTAGSNVAAARKLISDLQ